MHLLRDATRDDSATVIDVRLKFMHLLRDATSFKGCAISTHSVKIHAPLARCNCVAGNQGFLLLRGRKFANLKSLSFVGRQKKDFLEKEILVDTASRKIIVPQKIGIILSRKKKRNLQTQEEGIFMRKDVLSKKIKQKNEFIQTYNSFLELLLERINQSMELQICMYINSFRKKKTENICLTKQILKLWRRKELLTLTPN